MRDSGPFSAHRLRVDHLARAALSDSSPRIRVGPRGSRALERAASEGGRHWEERSPLTNPLQSRLYSERSYFHGIWELCRTIRAGAVPNVTEACISYLDAADRPITNRWGHPAGTGSYRIANSLADWVIELDTAGYGERRSRRSVSSSEASLGRPLRLGLPGCCRRRSSEQVPGKAAVPDQDRTH